MYDFAEWNTQGTHQHKTKNRRGKHNVLNLQYQQNRMSSLCDVYLKSAAYTKFVHLADRIAILIFFPDTRQHCSGKWSVPFCQLQCNEVFYSAVLLSGFNTNAFSRWDKKCIQKCSEMHSPMWCWTCSIFRSNTTLLEQVTELATIQS